MQHLEFDRQTKVYIVMQESNPWPDGPPLYLVQWSLPAISAPVKPSVRFS